MSAPTYTLDIQTGEGGYYTAYAQLAGQNAWHKVGELVLFYDSDGAWVNNIEVDANWRRRGVGTALIAEAIATEGDTIYFSDHYEDPEDDSDDTRHCSTEAAALANALIANGVNVEWKTPAWADESED
jgi:GNAT superfamily N-acetyltransferase